jgi:hypothetical protein
MDCLKCNENKRINDDYVICNVLKREISPFWGLISGHIKCPKTSLSRYDEANSLDNNSAL